MGINLVLIIDFFNKQELEHRYINFEGGVSFCSVLIKWLLKNFFFQQIAIILPYKKIKCQICHFTNNTFHHTQGVRRCREYTFAQNDIKSAIIFAKRLLDFTNEKKNSEIMIVSSGCYSYNSVQTVITELIKNKIKFSSINVYKKSFACEIMTRLTKGIHLIWNSKKDNFFTFRYKFFLKKFFLNMKFLIIDTECIKIYSPIAQQAEMKLCKISKYCSFCKKILNSLQVEHCSYCKRIYFDVNISVKKNVKFFKLEFLCKKFNIFACKSVTEIQAHTNSLKMYKNA